MPDRTRSESPEDQSADEALPAGDDHVADLAEEFLDRLIAGESPDREAFLASHAEIADKLEDHLDLLEGLYHSRRRMEDPPAASTLTADIQSPQVLPDRVGPYRILRRIGGGGMGVVYLAEQSGPVRRKVALKMIRKDMDTRDVLARFDTERQALGLMDHPGIARVFDAGSDDSDRPYFVMEHVAGEPLTSYCDRNRLSPLERLGLFGQVCDAVQHAHQKGVIHRDLKPSNVLVTTANGKPMPKIIDFGIAKAVVGRLTDNTLSTEYGQIIGTPEYMSPEQAAGNSIDVDTRTDIYSLGVILYELLTGTPPFSSHELRSAGLDESRRRICEVEPPKPSTRVSTLGKAALRAASKRQTEPKRLSRMLKGDLDWITMKALEKDRNRRYATALELGEEIRRHLDHEPVKAGAPSGFYRLRKFVRKHRIWFGAGMVAGLALLGGLTVSTFMYLRSDRDHRSALAAKADVEIERGRAEDESERYRAVTAFLQGVFASIDPERVGQSIKIAQLLADAEKDIEDIFRGRPEVEGSVRGAIAEIYEDLGLYEDAQRNLEASIAVRRRALGDQHRDTLASTAHLGKILQHRGRLADAERTLRGILTIQRRVLGEDDSDTLATTASLGDLFAFLNRMDEAEELQRRCLEIRRRVLGPEDPLTLESISVLADSLRWTLDFAESEELHRELIRARQHSLGDSHPDTFAAMVALARLLVVVGKREEANEICQRSLEMLEIVSPTDSADPLSTLAAVLFDLNRRDESGRVRRIVLESVQQRMGSDHPRTALAMRRMGSMLMIRGEYREAERLYRRVLDYHQQRLGDDHAQTLASMSRMAKLLLKMGRWKEAEELQRRVLVGFGRIFGEAHPDTFLAETDLAWVLVKTGDWREAERLLAKGLDRSKRVLGEMDNRTLGVRNQQAVLLDRMGRYEQSEAIYRDVLEAARELKGKDHSDTLTTSMNLATSIAEQGRYDEAVPMLRKVVETRVSIMGDDHPATLNSMHLLASALSGQGKTEEAERYYDLVLEGRRLVLGDDHPATLNSWAHVADRARVRGDFDEAEKVRRDILAGWVRLGGEDHRNTVGAQINLAQILTYKLEFDEAEQLSRSVLESRKRRFGNEEPETLRAMHNLGWVLRSAGKLGEAQQHLEQALESGRRVLGEEDTHTLQCKKQLLRLFLKRGDLSEAERLATEALPRFRRVYGNNDSQTLQILASLGEIHRRKREFSEAERILGEVLESRRRVFGETHRETGFAMQEMAALLEAQGKIPEAEKLLRETLEIRIRALGEGHVDTVGTMERLGDILRDHGKLAEAEVFSRKAFEARLEDVGPDHSWTLHSLHNLAWCIAYQGRREEAEGMLREVLDRRRNTLGVEHPDSVRAMTTLADLLHKFVHLDPPVESAPKKNAEAISLYERAIEIQVEARGEDHPKTVVLIEMLAHFYIPGPYATEREGTLRRAAKIRRRTLGDEHLKTLNVLNDLAISVRDNGKLEEAIRLSRQLLEARRRSQGPKHPDTLRTMITLAKALLLSGGLEEAEHLGREAVGYADEALPDSDTRRWYYRVELGAVLTAAGKFAQAEKLLIEALSKLAGLQGKNHRLTRRAALVLVDLSTAWGKPEKAAEYRALLESSEKRR
ncbi:MAG: tetratricopeptide repeat protein [Planctomycetota bacterium]|nr:tetratricopeptide repeat protein [Planctomycetota bacterium]